MFSFSFVNQLTIALSLFTTTGIALHDTKLDKAYISTVETPITARSESLPVNVIRTSELHTHVESGAYAQAIHDLQNGTPRIKPRDDIKKHVTSKSAGSGHHAFDNYNLPLV